MALEMGTATDQRGCALDGDRRLNVGLMPGLAKVACNVVLLVEGGLHLVDDPVPTVHGCGRLDHSALAAVDVVLRPGSAVAVDAGLDRRLVVGGGVLPQ